MPVESVRRALAWRRYWRAWVVSRVWAVAVAAVAAGLGAGGDGTGIVAREEFCDAEMEVAVEAGYG